jgi:hypothetical protein
MKVKLFLTIAIAAVLPATSMAADAPASDQSVQDTELNKLVTEMNSAPSDQKIDAIVTLLNKLVEQRKLTPEQTQQKSMCMCCDVQKSNQDENVDHH